MPRTENGQFEVLLGNRQLLSILFIVVILLGVFFTMGYILGRNSAAGEAASATAAAPAQRAGSANTQQTGASPFAGESRPPGSPESAPEQPGVEPQALPLPTEQPASASEPAPGETYLQVAAVKRPEAELIAEVLKKKGFSSMVAPHPTEPVFRVLVGPLNDVDEIAKARVDLQAAGFKPILRKF